MGPYGTEKSKKKRKQFALIWVSNGPVTLPYVTVWWIGFKIWVAADLLDTGPGLFGPRAQIPGPWAQNWALIWTLCGPMGLITLGHGPKIPQGESPGEAPLGDSPGAISLGSKAVPGQFLG